MGYVQGDVIDNSSNQLVIVEIFHIWNSCEEVVEEVAGLGRSPAVHKHVLECESSHWIKGIITVFICRDEDLQMHGPLFAVVLCDHW